MKKPSEILRMRLEDEATWPVAAAAGMVKSGGVLIYPTDTIYGMGCSSYNAEAIERIYRIKSRSDRKPMLVLLPDVDWMPRVVREAPDTLFSLAQRFWPGPLTIVLRAREDLPAVLTADTGTIGVRVPQQPFTRALVRSSEAPLVSTSANPSGGHTVLHIRKLIELFQFDVDMIVDAGDLVSGVESTVISLVDGRMRPLREGRVPIAEIEQVLS